MLNDKATVSASRGVRAGMGVVMCPFVPWRWLPLGGPSHTSKEEQSQCSRGGHFSLLSEMTSFPPELGFLVESSCLVSGID